MARARRRPGGRTRDLRGAVQRFLRPLMPSAAYRRLLQAAAIVVAILATAMVAVSPGLRARPLPEATVTLLNPILGQDAPSGQVVFPKEPPGGVTAADLGAPAYFKGSWYLVFGDA